MNQPYDYLVVGAGLYGSVFAYEMHKRGKRCLVVDKTDHAAGHIYTSQVEGNQVHRYGTHIFHAHDAESWQYVQQFDDFNHYVMSAEQTPKSINTRLSSPNLV